MSIEIVKQLNPAIPFYTIDQKEFEQYGRVLSYDTSEVVSYVKETHSIPPQGSIYLPDIKSLHAFPLFNDIQKNIFGCMDIQCGLVHGNNNKLTGIEYHQGSEVNVAIEDCILLLGRTSQLENNHFNGSKAKAFYLKKGQAIELYSTTLHYTPLQASRIGFSTLVYLLQGTNTDIAYTPNEVLTKKNKWYICHPSQKEKRKSGYVPGLDGELIIVNYESM